MFALVGGGPTPPVYHGRRRELDVQPPRIEATVAIDGRLDEEPWRRAAVLTGFSQYAPLDEQPAEDSTEVLVWYSPTAMHFGVRAWARPGTVRATLADRDKIYNDDYVGVLLGTYDDGRQATVFAVNPLGVQGDGTMLEGARGLQQGVGREPADISPDYVFESKGRLTDYGFEVEIRIPFKSLRYQRADPQRWGLAVIRRVQSTGHEDSWTPARRAASSFLAQSGRLTGLTGLHRGIVMDLNPSVTTSRAGAVDGDGVWRQGRADPEVGGYARWGVTNDLTLTATANPDFSQVETDAGQLVFDPRDPQFFEEKRPFFQEGIEQFTLPTRLVYTRRIVAPDAAAKLTSTVAGTRVALLSARDDRRYSATGEDHPLYNVARLQRDLGAQSRLGVVYTDKRDGGRSNQVAGVDGRLVFARLYSVQFQGAGSWTRVPGLDGRARPLWRADFARSGRTFGLRATALGVHRDFVASTGFIRRDRGYAQASPSLTWYGRRGAVLESVSGFLLGDGTWSYDAMMRGDNARDQRGHVGADLRLRGGWNFGGIAMRESWGYDPSLFAGYALEQGTNGVIDTVEFTGPRTLRLPARDFELHLVTPRFQRFSGDASVLWGRDVNFFEWAPSDIVFLFGTLGWRPTDRARLDGTFAMQRYRRPDHSTVNTRRLPRVKAEYQLARPLFLRVVTEYDVDLTDALRDDAERTGARLLRYDGEKYVLADESNRRALNADVLLSYQPNPGTVVFVGYGGTTSTPEPEFRARAFHRERDALFVKVSYLFRL
ncbi:MAG TPA: DUF5916 domain-containing protein [Gemmatimonadaceae bacterium]|nr:DUF5916 domain-containing protein [Gemmatimonadaceae bacterium]